MQLCQSSLWVVRRGRETTACVAGTTLGWSTQVMCSREVSLDGGMDLSSFNCPQSFMSLTHGLINLPKMLELKDAYFSYILSRQCKSSSRHMILDQGNDNLFLHWKKIWLYWLCWNTLCSRRWLVLRLSSMSWLKYGLHVLRPGEMRCHYTNPFQHGFQLPRSGHPFTYIISPLGRAAHPLYIPSPYLYGSPPHPLHSTLGYFCLVLPTLLHHVMALSGQAPHLDHLVSSTVPGPAWSIQEVINKYLCDDKCLYLIPCFTASVTVLPVFEECDIITVTRQLTD